MAKDVDLFAAAMSGVKPLKGHKRTGHAKTVIPRAKAEGPLKSAGKVPRRARDDKGAGTRSRRSEFRPRHLPLPVARQACAAGLARSAWHDAGRRRARRFDFSRGRHRPRSARRADRHRQGPAPGGRSHAGRPHPQRVRGLAEPRRQPPSRARRAGSATRGMAAAAPFTCCCGVALPRVVLRPAAAPCAPRPSDSPSAHRSRRRRDGRE